MPQEKLKFQADNWFSADQICSVSTEPSFYRNFRLHHAGGKHGKCLPSDDLPSPSPDRLNRHCAEETSIPNRQVAAVPSNDLSKRTKTASSPNLDLSHPETESDAPQNLCHGQISAKTDGRKPAQVVGDLDMRRVSIDCIASLPNLWAAVTRVARNTRKAAGPDGICVENGCRVYDRNIGQWQNNLLAGTYAPGPGRQCLIPKASGGKRPLVILNVSDRITQTAVLRQMEANLDYQFSDHSYGFRPGRNCLQAMREIQTAVQDGHEFIVQIDLRNFFGLVSHDKLMVALETAGLAPPVREILQRIVTVGLVTDADDGKVVTPTTVGLPQGAPLSPILANVVLHPLDQELERRGHHFARYADDLAIAVGSPAAGRRVLLGITAYLQDKLGIEVNRDKSSVKHFPRIKFLGYALATDTSIRIPDHQVAAILASARSLRTQPLEHGDKRFRRWILSSLSYYKYAEDAGINANLVKQITGILLPHEAAPGDNAPWLSMVSELRRRIAKYPLSGWGQAVEAIETMIPYDQRNTADCRQ